MKERILELLGLPPRIRFGFRLALKRSRLIETAYVQRTPQAGKPVVATVVSCFNHIEFTRKTVESYYAGLDDRFDHVLIAIDDCSSDETAAYFLGEARRFSNIGYLRYRWNMGLTQTWNDGVDFALRRLNADCVFLINSDVLIPKDALSRMVDHLQADAGIGVISCLTNQPGHQPLQDIRRLMPGYGESDSMAAIECVQAALERRPAVAVDYVNGFFWGGLRPAFVANVYWRFLRSYYFNPLNRNIGNEDEFQRRLRTAGFLSVIAEDCFVFHYKDVSQQRFGIGP